MSTLRKGQTGTRAINAAISGAALTSYAVADLPDAASSEGRLVHCSDGAAGSPCLAYSDGTAWLRVTLGAAVATV